MGINLGHPGAREVGRLVLPRMLGLGLVQLNQLTNVVPGALKVYDLPDLAAAIAPRPLTIEGAVDPANRK